MKPKVSICVPNLNTRPFLAERFETIFNQSFQDWEVLVYDSYSTDGAWDYIRDVAANEPRMRAWQGPREGPPVSWNPCIRQARGEYVYVATSDDTMPPDCLQKLVAALDSNPDCDIAHCRLRAIDTNGREAEEMCHWWSNYSVFAYTSGPMVHRLHVRRAPLDGLLHLLGGSVYISITQLLIRRTLFDRIGFFESTWGSVSDFNWNMRAGLVASTIHVPDTWGGWRIHASQATAAVIMPSPEHARRVDAMIDHAIDVSQHSLSPAVREYVNSRWKDQAKELRHYARELDRHQSRPGRYAFVARRLLEGSTPAWQHIRLRARGLAIPDWVGASMEGAGLRPMLLPAVAASSRLT